MTKYVLNSGGVRHFPDRAKAFYREVVKDLGKRPRILLCLFAHPREDWEEKFVEYANGFAKQMQKGTQPSFELAFPAKFEKQVSNCDVVYITGGDDHLVQYWLNKFNLPKLWKGKVVATSSAGSDALVKHFWTCDWRQCMDGLGILPIKFLPHFQSEYGVSDPRGSINWSKAKKELEKYGDQDLPIYALKEGDFVVFEK